MKYKLITADVMDWLNLASRYNYRRNYYHAMLTDAPYHLTSITERFGKEGSAPAKGGVYNRSAHGFMGQRWDGGTLAFEPELWAGLKEMLMPGAFCFAFAGSRGWHRMAVAIEGQIPVSISEISEMADLLYLARQTKDWDVVKMVENWLRGFYKTQEAIKTAGFIIHPTIFGYAFGSGFPKATNVMRFHQKARRGWRGDSISNQAMIEMTLRQRADLLAKEKKTTGLFYGLQAIKPAIEPVLCFQKPYDGKPVDCITSSGAGALNIEKGRIGASNGDDYGRSPNRADGTRSRQRGYSWGEGLAEDSGKSHPSGRWPANLTLTHHPGCVRVGVKRVRGSDPNRFSKTDGGWAVAKFDNPPISNIADPDGLETVDDYRCVEGCAVRRLGEMSGELKSGEPSGTRNATTGFSNGITPGAYDLTGFGDSGTAARYFHQSDWSYEVLEQLAAADPLFYTAKPGNKERNAGLVGLKNIHPTQKPISLTKHLASLLLPPPAYAPCRILVPFSGASSEMIGAMLAGFDEITGIEMTQEYIPIARARMAWWSEWLKWGQTDVETILSSINSEEDERQLALF